MKLDDRPTLALTQVGTYGRDTVLLGVKLGNGRLLWDRRQSAFLLISGEQGSGKSVLIRVIEVHDLKVGNIVVSLEVKPDDSWATGAVSRAITPAGWIRALEWVVDQMKDRIAICEANKVPHIANVDPDTPWLTIFAHEFPGIVGEEAVIELGEKGRNHAVSLVTKICKVGRALRVTMVAGTQDPTLYGTFGSHKSGGAIRRQFNGRAHFDSDSDSLRAAFDGLISPVTDRMLQVPHKGRCAVLGLHPDDGPRAVAAQIWHITPDLAAPFAAAYQGPPPIDFDAGPRTKDYG